MVGTLVRGCRCATSWSDLDLILDLAVVTLTYKILSGLCNARREIHTAAVVLFHFVMPSPLPPPQCIQRFYCYHSNEKNIITSLLKFAGYIHNHKILPGNIFGLILKKKMAASKDFRWPSREKDIIARDLKFTGYVPHYKIFSLILKMIFLLR